MNSRLQLVILTLLLLIAMDGFVAGGLYILDKTGRGEALIQYFDYGRSTPGKIAQWAKNPDRRDSLLHVAWRDEIKERSQIEFETTVSTAPVIRAYGMSFVKDILLAAQKQDDNLVLDFHTGPGAPANFTYTVFKDDRPFRREGDIAVLGVLSSSVPALAAMSNRSWVFEQPGPFTYPVYDVDERGALSRIDPLVQTQEDQARLTEDASFAAAWRRQQQEHDAFYAPITMEGEFLDASPFARLVRRYFSKRHISAKKKEMVAENSAHTAYPWRQVLSAMVQDFAQEAKADGQIPVVFLIATRGEKLPLNSALKAAAAESGAYILWTGDHISQYKAANFKPDGHYTSQANAVLGEAFTALLEKARNDAL